MLHTLAITWPGPFEMMLLAGLGLLIFGKRLPEVGKSLGKGIVEFKRGLKGVQDEVTQVDESIDDQAAANRRLPDQTAATAAGKPKFDPYTGKPIEEETAAATTKAKFDPYTGKPVEENV